MELVWKSSRKEGGLILGWMNTIDLMRFLHSRPTLLKICKISTRKVYWRVVANSRRRFNSSEQRSVRVSSFLVLNNLWWSNSIPRDSLYNWSYLQQIAVIIVFIMTDSYYMLLFIRWTHHNRSILIIIQSTIGRDREKILLHSLHFFLPISFIQEVLNSFGSKSISKDKTKLSENNNLKDFWTHNSL